MNISDIGKSMTSGRIEKKAPPKKKKEAEETKDSVQLGTGLATPEMPKMEDIKETKAETEPEEKKAAGSGKSKEGINLKFIHMNDYHGYVEELDKAEGQEQIIGGIARLAGKIKDLKTENPQGTITLDGGDVYDGGFYSKVTKGEIVSKPLAAMGFDASVIGNHDVTWGLDAYATIAKDMNTDILGAANVTDLSPAGDLKFLKPYKIIEREGVKIGILGITTPMTSLSTPQKGIIEIGDPRQATESFVKKLRDEEKVDMVVLLSHLGYSEDVKLAEKVKGIDLIVGAHSHTVMHDAEKVGDAIIVQAGGEGKYVGDLNLVFDPSSKKIVSYKENLIPITADIKPDPAVTKIIAPYIEKYESVKNEVLGKTSENLELISNKRTNLCNLFVDAQKKDSDLAVTSSFSIRKGIEKGDVTTGKLFQMYPFDNELVQIKAKGATVLKFLEGGLRFVEGDKDNYALVSGLSYEFNPTLLEGNRITSVTFKGKKMTPQEFAKKNITMSMDNYTYGKSYFKEGKMLQKYGRVFDVLKDYIKENSPLQNISKETYAKQVSEVPDPGLVANVKIGTLSKDTETAPSDTKFTCASKFYGDAIRGDADMSFGYTKSIRTRLPEGEINRATLKKMYPFDNELVKVKASGKQVLDFLEYLRGDRFLGKEQALSSGITYKYDTSKPEGKRIVSVTVGDKTYDRAEFTKGSFTICMDSMLAGSKFKGAETIEEKGSAFKILENHLKENSPLHIPLLPSPGTDVNPNPSSATDSAKELERKKKILQLGLGKIKPEEVGEFSLSKVNTFVNAPEFFAQEKAMIDRAKNAVGVTMYTLTRDDMIEALTSKAKEKVAVRTVVDPHIHTTPDKMLERMEAQKKLLEGGVRYVEDPGDHIFCNHSKTVNVDGKEAAVSKINMAPYSDEYHDYGVTIEGGKAVNDVENFFSSTWHMAGGKQLKASPRNDDVEGGVPVKLVTTNPDVKSYNTPYNNITRNFTETAKSVKGQYFSLTSKPLVNRLIEMKEKDPEKSVKIMLNEGIFLENALAQQLAQQMMDKGIEVKLYKDAQGKLHTLHSATTSFDGNEMTLGSANTTFGGLFSNREADVNVVGVDTIKPFESQFDVDWESNSRDITPEDLKLASQAEGDDKEEAEVKAYYDVPFSEVSKHLGIEEKRLHGALSKIYDILGYSDFNDKKSLEIRLAVQKLASYAYKDNKEFDKTIDRFCKILTVETADMANPEKETTMVNKLINDAREALGSYIVLNNIVINDPKANIDDLTDKFVAMFKEMSNPGGDVNITMDVRSKFADMYGIE